MDDLHKQLHQANMNWANARSELGFAISCLNRAAIYIEKLGGDASMEREAVERLNKERWKV